MKIFLPALILASLLVSSCDRFATSSPEDIPGEKTYVYKQYSKDGLIATFHGRMSSHNATIFAESVYAEYGQDLILLSEPLP